MTQSSSIALSICIATFNRSAFLREALDSIISQVTDNCEIVVSDNASTDDTELVVSTFATRFEHLRYLKQSANVGLDRNFDCAVLAATGRYCWLFSDDDLMKPGAINTVIEATRYDYSLILVNGEHRDFTMSAVRIPNFFGIHTSRIYKPGEVDRLFSDVGTCLMCLCCVVIKRSIWLSRERKKYYGSWFIQVGVILQEPLPGETLVISQPLISLRLGNVQTGMAEAISFHTWCISWPSLIWSLPLAEATKRSFSSCADSWKDFRYLLAYRAEGRYSSADYNRWIRPRVRPSSEMLLAYFAAHVPRRVAPYLLALLSIILGGPRSPYDTLATMYPQSFKVLRVRSN